MNTALPVILAVLCGGIIWAGYRYYRAQHRSIESAIHNQLSAIANLKVQQIVAWRRERIAEASLLASGPMVAAPPSGENNDRLSQWLQTFRKLNGYAAVLILDPSGGVRSQASGAAVTPDSSLLPLIAAALASGHVAVSDLHEQAGSIYLDFVAPVRARNEVVVLRQEAAAFLYALVEAWPNSSQTAESLLVRREGNSVRFLTALRHEKGATLHLTRPLAGDLPAAMAARGMEGVYPGRDYRGVAVLAALRQVPETPWALIAKVDAEEVYAPLRQRTRAIGLVVALLLTGALAAFGFFWNLEKSRFYQRQHQAGLEKIALAGRYAHLRGYVNDAVLLIDEDGNIVEANDRAAATHGYSIDELLGLPIQALLQQPEAPDLREIQANLEQTGGHVFESVHRRKDGSTLRVEVSARKVTVNGRNFHQSIIRDITERKRAEEQLRRVTRAMRVLSASNQALVRSRDEASLLQAICVAITDAGGYPLAWIGFAENDEQKSVSLVAASGRARAYLDAHRITWIDEPLGRGPTGTSIRAGRIAVCNNVDTDACFEPWRAKADQFGFRSVIGLPLYCEGVVIGALTIYASEPDAFGAEEMGLLEELTGDLSYGIEAHRRRLDQARAEHALLQSAMEFRTLFDNANDAIFIADLQGRLLEANLVACERLGYGRDELVSMTVQDIDSPDYKALWPGRLAELSGRSQLLFETLHVRKDGTDLPVEINSRLFYYRHAPALLNVARDISDRKQAEAEARRHAQDLERAKTDAESASRAKSQFLANMSHEIRTPMNGILGMSGLLLDTSLSGEQQDYAETIRNSADALLAIVNDVLDFSKIEAGRMEIEPVRFNIIACLEEIGELMAPQARLKGVQYIFEERVHHRWVIGDAGRLRQIVLNLLSNAIKFTNHGQVTLSISCSESSEELLAFTIAVADTGIGIAADDLGLLFQTFSQIDSSLSKKHQGTGLGLAISRKLAELMGGTLTAASQLGRGSRFVLALPAPRALEAIPENHWPSGEQNLPRVTRDGKCRRILLAEDNAVNQKIGVRLLEKCGCRVDVAANGREAVEMAGRLPYDLIFMDCGMPEMDGYAATRAIRAQQIGAPYIPIVALTAHVIAGTREECLAAGMDDYIAKPVSLAAMEQTLVKWSP